MSMKCKPFSKAQCKYVRVLVDTTIEAILGGRYSVSYRMLSDVCLEELLDDLEAEFGTRKFSRLCNCRFDEIVEFLANWFPSDETMDLSCELEEALEKFIYRIVDDIPKESAAYQQIMEDFINAVCTSSEGLE